MPFARYFCIFIN
ncbi:replication protein, partial [Escherichia coli EC1850]